ncbi:MAG: hypothetical protein ACI88C_003415 [Acidimicrobiales bacterium]|jgi:hypothetical protein
MRRSITILVLASALGLFVVAATFELVPSAAAQELDSQVPPGNPVIGDDRPGDVVVGSDLDYALWGAVAVCLIAAGVLLVRIEKWETRRIEHQAPNTQV